MKQYACIDIGGTAVKYGIVGEQGEIRRRGETPTQAYQGGSAVLEKAVGLVRTLQQEETIQGICISTAGMVDTAKGEIFYSAPLIPGYAGTRFKETMEREFALPCEVENDVNCAGLAEYMSGAAQGSSVALMLTIGTGIGGCMLVDGKVFHGSCNSACEIGYMHMRGSDFQTLGSAGALAKKVAAWKDAPEEEWNGRRIFEEAKAGDSLCSKAIDEMVDVLGEGIANICFVANPEIVVLGGGIMAQETFLKGRITEAVRRYLVPVVAEHTRIAFARHGNDAGMLGAFYHFRKMHNTMESQE